MLQVHAQIFFATTPEIVPLEYSAPLSKPAFLSQQRWWPCLNDGDVITL